MSSLRQRIRKSKSKSKSKSKISKRKYKTTKRRDNKRTRRFKKTRKQYGGVLEEEKIQQLIGIFEKIGFSPDEIDELMKKFIHYSSYYNNPTKQKEYEIMIIYLDTIARENFPPENKKIIANDFIRQKIIIWDNKYKNKGDLPDTDTEFGNESDDEHLEA
jgi:hypothetical protein